MLGIVLAAAALLADFARNLARLTLNSVQPKRSPAADLREIDNSISQLQTVLDTSKTALTGTERQLDETLNRANLAEGAISSMGDSREAISDAKQQASDAYIRLSTVRDALQLQTARRDDVRADMTVMRQERARLQRTIDEREAEVADLTLRLDAERAQPRADEQQRQQAEQRERALQDELDARGGELVGARAERDEMGREAELMAQRVGTLEEEAEMASRALAETRDELQRVLADVADREADLARVEQDAASALRQSVDAERLRKVVSGMERELGELQGELRARDQVVRDVEKESDELRSILAARDVELRGLSSKLESAISAEQDKGGDSRQSDLNLEDVKSSLNTEQMALAAEIAHAELASYDIGEDDLDPLDRLTMEIGAEGGRFQANLRRAETALKRDENERLRKDGAVREILQSVEEEVDREDAAGQWPPVYPNNDELGDISGADEAGDAESAKVKGKTDVPAATSKSAKSGTKKKRKSGEESASTGMGKSKSEGGDSGEKVRRKRGRPRKTKP